ncbi:DUF86 domain-containing protein [Candidatus Methylospira mobilis]|uniref:DUF86 domain-containing protein n=1 Tax=Candidatus Methylospira mobilis TaxID=1808979 RepID=A0A5Q0BE12_9GAMM|nr:DUF86 domain-containing protein [Candidatus Methylospira mobilis]QFY41769.1 DUF86 domain-containing protein [Candidatus Methylospira mobilis]WNV06630.1 DUF86 domain-containing protein [Candidatus Methylospira mobilis]
MQFALYQAETARIAAEQAALLAEARGIMAQQRQLSQMEQAGVLHTLQVLIENAIGKAKQLLKAINQPVPVSGYDAFAALSRCGMIDASRLPAWNAVIGLRNRIVHDYMNVDMVQVLKLVSENRESLVTDFLYLPVNETLR